MPQKLNSRSRLATIQKDEQAAALLLRCRVATLEKARMVPRVNDIQRLVSVIVYHDDVASAKSRKTKRKPWVKCDLLKMSY